MARITAFGRQVDAFNLGLQGTRTEIMVQAAHLAFDSAQAQNRSILGYDPPFQQLVDGQPNAPLESVKPGGTIVYLFAVGGATLTEAVDEAIKTFLQIAPVGSGRDEHPGLYRGSLVLLVNGVQRDAREGTAITFAETDVVALTNLQPYARKIERGSSAQAPNGVMEVVEVMLRTRYGNILKIDFSYDIYPGFEVGKTRTGGALLTAKDHQRAARYPTVTLSLK